MQWTWTAVSDAKIEVFYTLLVFVCVLLVVRYIQYLSFIRTLPPGPWGLPIFGYLHMIKRYNLPLHLQFSELAKKYGSIFSVKLGNQLVVVLSDYNLIRDTFDKKEFTGRPHTEFINILDGYGIINTEGAMWKDQRKFLQKKLIVRNSGMTYSDGMKNLESNIMYEVKKFLCECANQNGRPTNISSSLAMSISNVICTLIMGVRFHRGEQRFKRFMNLIEEGFKLFASVVCVNYIPYTRYLPNMKDVQDKISRNRVEMAQFFQETIDEQRRTYIEGNMRHLVDSYLLKIRRAKEEGRETELFQGKNHDRQMQQILGDLFSAGMETVKTTLEWAVLLMLHNPEAARAVQEELDQVVGRSRMPTMKDKANLPITDATIQEILRRTSIVPLGTTHATTENVTLECGYTIPAGSQVVPLLHAVHMDPQLWEDPETFKPSRFLNDKGEVVKPKYFMPFGYGKRLCLGIVLAHMELFLYFSSLMHTFDLRLPEGASLPSLRGNAGVTVSPDPFKVCLLVRKPNLIDLDDNNEIVDGPLRNVGSH